MFSSNTFIPLSCKKFDDSLPFSGASSIPLYYVLFPATLPHHYSSILSHLIFPSISWSASQSCCSQNHIIFWELYLLPFSEHVQTNVIGLYLCSVIIVVLKSYERTIFSMMLSDKVGVIWWRCLMINEFVKVHNISKAILLRAWVQRKQQQ